MTSKISSLAVFCGSNQGRGTRFTDVATRLGRYCGLNSIRIVYGGGRVGLMGVVADAAMANGGEVVGVITRALEEKEVAHESLSSLLVVDTMHERKAVMADAADGFVMLPGGFGTLDEFFEALTWTQLGIHEKPCGILNADGYYDSLIEFLDRAVQEQFISEAHVNSVVVDVDPEQLIARMSEWQPVTSEKWLDLESR